MMAICLVRAGWTRVGFFAKDWSSSSAVRAITAPQRAIFCCADRLAKHLGHRDRLATSSLARTGQDCGPGHDTMEALPELVDMVVSRWALHDSGE